MSDIHKLLSLFDTAAQDHGWASDQGTRAQAQTALANYQRARGDLEQALDAHAAEIKRLRAALNEAVRVLESARLLCNWPSMNEAMDAAARAGRAALQSQDREDVVDRDVVAKQLRDMASSAYQTAMAFGVSQDNFERLAYQVFDNNSRILDHARRIEGGET